jgi:hypothetical protein
MLNIIEKLRVSGYIRNLVIGRRKILQLILDR